ncbi:hypothetical protein [Hymenobacter terrenus]|uniref:hypothetical protein n=1 Tax=Hymenobacter terrenus TaxID=1629124 RepID=UPI001E6359CD|nr:hypothetical protein [Hymenobacter terrenus]
MTKTRRNDSLTKSSGIVSRTSLRAAAVPKLTTLREQRSIHTTKYSQLPPRCGKYVMSAHPDPIGGGEGGWPSKQFRAAHTVGAESIVRGREEWGCWVIPS